MTKPVFTVAPPNTDAILESIKLIGAATAQYYQSLIDAGIAPETARDLTAQFIKMLPEMWKQAG